MKRAMLKTLLAAAVVAIALPAAAQSKLKWAHVYETGEPYHTESVWAAEEIKKRTNGKFEIQVFPASSLGKETDINQGMQLGTVDMIISGSSFAARSYPRLGIAYYPFIFRDADHLLAYSKSPVFKEMVDEFRAKTGIQILAYTYYGARHTTANKPILDCAAMKGLKIRVPDVPIYRNTPEACGANATPIAFAEVYLALQNGTVDMIISGPSFAARSYPRLGIAYYPFIFRDADHLIAYSKSDVFGEMVEGYRAKTGIQILAYTYYGARQTTAQKPFSDCAGMKGIKIRVPDVPAYTATPKACGANPTPIAFAEVYLALQNGTVDAQENPLTTIEAKKFFEVQKAIMMTGHIVDGLTTQVAPHIWNTLSATEKTMFTEVAREAAARSTADIKKREGELVDEFKKKGLAVVNVDRKSFVDAVLKSSPVESMGFDRKDYDRITSLK